MPAVGIDLGTTNTVVAAVREGVAQTIPDPQGHRLLPSVVSFHPSGSTLVGYAARERRLLDAPNTVYSVKRLMGLPWDSPEVQASRAKLPFELGEGAHGGAVVAVRGERYTLPEISAFVLRHAKAVAEAALGEPVEHAVVTVPANFNDLQRAATKMAGRLAGLDVLRILNEPTAAALAYGPPSKPQERIAVYDLGGGTFDFTLLDLAGNVFEVLATAGDTSLGGDDIDLLVVDRMADEILRKHRFDARAHPATVGQLRVLAEEVKRDLSTRDEKLLSVDDLVPGEKGSLATWRFSMTRTELEKASLALIERTFRVCAQALEAAGVKSRELDRIVLVGGVTRMPLVAREVERFFGQRPIVRINPDEVVALGAAIQAALLDRSRRKGAEPMRHPTIAEASVAEPLPDESIIESDSADSASDPGLPSLPLVGPRRAPAAAVRVAPATFLPGAPSKPLVFDVPEQRPPARTIFYGAGSQAPPAVPPPLPARPRSPTMPFPFDAAASVGAARAPDPPPPPLTPAPPAALLAPSLPPRPPPLLIDVTPLSLSVETVGGYCDVLIEANTPVPCDRTRSFSTAADGQTVVVVRVAQGKSVRFSENTFLGELELSGIAAAPRGQTQIAVTFEIDADGILQVRARDKETGRETTAHMQVVGADVAPGDVEAMHARQAAHPLAPLEGE
ncbi:MAG: Hsp70 family protein [Polyangiaceae bacterium]